MPSPRATTLPFPSGTLFGCRILTDRSTTASAQSALRLEQGETPPTPPAGLLPISPFAALSPEGAWHRVPGLFRAWTRSADEILWQAERALSPEACAELLLDICLPAALLLKGYEVRPGFTVCRGERTMVVIGERPSVTFRTLLELLGAGYRYMSEGLCVFRERAEGGFEALPGPPRIRVWDDKFQLLPPQRGRRPRASVCIRSFEEPARFHGEPRPLTHILLLSPAEGAGAPPVRELTGRERLAYLEHGRPPWLAGDPLGDRARSFRRLGALAETVRLLRVDRDAMWTGARKVMEALP